MQTKRFSKRLLSILLTLGMLLGMLPAAALAAEEGAHAVLSGLTVKTADGTQDAGIITAGTSYQVQVSITSTGTYEISPAVTLYEVCGETGIPVGTAQPENPLTEESPTAVLSYMWTPEAAGAVSLKAVATIPDGASGTTTLFDTTSPSAYEVAAADPPLLMATAAGDTAFTLTVKSNLDDAGATFNTPEMTVNEAVYTRDWKAGATISQTLYLKSYKTTEYTFKGWSINGAAPVKTGGPELFTQYGVIPDEDSSSGIIDTTAAARPFAGGTVRINNSTVADTFEDVTLTAIFERRASEATLLVPQNTSATVWKGQTVNVGVTLDADITPTIALSCTSANSGVATATGGANEDGSRYIAITGANAGMTNITPKIGTAITGAAVTVNVLDMTLDKSTLYMGYMGPGGTKELNLTLSHDSSVAAPAVTWISSDTDVLTVAAADPVAGTGSTTQTATLTGKKAGTATVTAAAEGKSVECTVTVSEVTNITVPAALDVNKSAGTASLKATLEGVGTTPVTWFSDNTAVASVSDTTGNVNTLTLNHGGTAVVTATAVTTDGLKTVSCTVNVTSGEAGESISITAAFRNNDGLGLRKQRDVRTVPKGLAVSKGKDIASGGLTKYADKATLFDAVFSLVKEPGLEIGLNSSGELKFPGDNDWHIARGVLLNGVPVNYSKMDYVLLEPGDDVVLYLISTDIDSKLFKYAWFADDTGKMVYGNREVEKGDSLKLFVRGAGLDNTAPHPAGSPLADTNLYYYDEKATSGNLTPLTGEQAKTGADGSVTLTFDKAGAYTIAAAQGNLLIPVPTVTVLVKDGASADLATLRSGSIKAQPAFADRSDSPVYLVRGTSVQGSVASGATVKINGQTVTVDEMGAFSGSERTNEDILTCNKGYFIDVIEVTSADQKTTKTHTAILYGGNFAQEATYLVVDRLADAGGNSLPIGPEYSLEKTKLLREGEVNVPSLNNLIDGVIVVNSLTSARLRGTRSDKLPPLQAARIREVNSDGTFGDYQEAVVDIDSATYTTELLAFDPGYNVYLCECKVAGYEGWIEQGIVVVYREKTAAASKDVVLTPADITVTDGFGSVITAADTGVMKPGVNKYKIVAPVWNVTVPAGNDTVSQTEARIKLLRTPPGSTVTVAKEDIASSGNLLIPDGDSVYTMPLVPVLKASDLYAESKVTVYIKVTAENGLSQMYYQLTITREPRAPTVKIASLLYQLISAQPKDSSGRSIDLGVGTYAFALRMARTIAYAMPYPGTGNMQDVDFSAEGASKELYLTYRAPDSNPLQAQIASIQLDLLPLCLRAGATVTCKTVTDNGTETAVPVRLETVQIYENGVGKYIPTRYVAVVPHTGGFKETAAPNAGEYTKIVVTVHSPANIEKTETYYIFKVPKIAPSSVDISDIAVKYAKREDITGRTLYKHNTNFTEETSFDKTVTDYDLRVDYNCEYLYITPELGSPDILPSFTLNGKEYQLTDSLMLNGADGAVRLAEGVNTLAMTYKLQNNSTGASEKVYTLHITRTPNCNAKMTFSDNVGVIAKSDRESINAKKIGYAEDQTAFDLTVTADSAARTVVITQGGTEKASGTGTAAAKGLSLFSGVTVAVMDTASGTVNTYTISPYAYLPDAPTSTYAIAPSPGQFVNTSWIGFDNVRIRGSIGQPTEGNAGGSGGVSLGTFGGYLTYFYKDAVQNSKNNKYGADFFIGGNAFKGNNEPAGVMVAQDKDGDGKPDQDTNGNELWYELAGSLYYDDSTIHNYRITYTNPNPSLMPYISRNIPYTDNQGNSGFAAANVFHGQPYWADDDVYAYSSYPGYDAANFNSTAMTFTGSLLDAVKLGGRNIPVRFGYADCAPGYNSIASESGNPYRESHNFFDIDWAVDGNGIPVRLDSVSFIKIYSSTLYDMDSTGELSPEIMGTGRLDKIGAADVGRTLKPMNITLQAGGFDDIVLTDKDLPESGGVLDVNVGGRAFVQTVVTSDPADAMFVNNDRVTSGAPGAAFLSVTKDKERLIRVIVQRGEMEAYSVLLRLSGTATAANTALTDITVRRNGVRVDGLSRTGVYSYVMSVPANYGILQIVPKVKSGAAVTVNGSSLNKDGYVDVMLGEAGTDTKVTLVTTYAGDEETTILTITREKAPDTGSQTGTVTIDVEKFTLGQGFLVEPAQVTFNKGDTAADVTKVLLTQLYGSKGYISNDSDYGFYLADIYDPGRGALNIPSFITTALKDAGVGLDPTDIDPDYLGEFDYTRTSGWMITVNNLFIPVSAGAWELNDGDVIRWQFTLYGLGADVGNSSPDSDYGGKNSIIPRTNKDEIVFRLARINGMSSKNELLKAGSNQKKYDDAIAVLENLLSTQAETEAALTALRNLESIGTPTAPAADSSLVIVPKVTAKDGVAAASISAADMNKAIDDAKKNGRGVIVIAPEINGNAAKTTVELPKSSLSAMTADTNADLKIVTPAGSVTIPRDILTSIVSQAAGSTVTMAVEAVEAKALTAEQQKLVGDSAVFDISITSDGKNISEFGGKSITISLPYTLKPGENPEGVTVWYLNDQGGLEKMTCTYDAQTGLAAFNTTHLSKYAVGYSAEVAWINPFTDVKDGDWFFGAVKYVVRKELFNGTSTATFGPRDSMTRAMLVTVLHRLEGKPAVTAANGFTDVKSGQWYTEAVLWADANGIVTGYGNGLFGTDDPITREQMAAILYRYASLKKYDTSGANDLAAYTDAGGITSYALSAMKWANAEGLITGSTTTTLTPTGTASRAEVATILMRFAENVVK